MSLMRKMQLPLNQTGPGNVSTTIVVRLPLFNDRFCSNTVHYLFIEINNKGHIKCLQHVDQSGSETESLYSRTTEISKRQIKAK